jgi:hypothetical protein
MEKSTQSTNGLDTPVAGINEKLVTSTENSSLSFLIVILLLVLLYILAITVRDTLHLDIEPNLASFVGFTIGWRLTSSNKAAQLEIDHDKSCLGCGKKGHNRRCQRCKSAWYCSEHCQRISWPNHKQVCKDYFSLLTERNEILERAKFMINELNVRGNSGS